MRKSIEDGPTIATRSIVPICRTQYRSLLAPRSALRRVSNTIPGKETKGVVICPARAGGERDVGLAAVVQGGCCFVDRPSMNLPGCCGRGNNACCANGSGRCQGCDAEGLKRAAVEAVVQKGIAPTGEAEDGTINTPLRGHWAVVGEGVPWCCATPRVSRLVAVTQWGMEYLPISTCTFWLLRSVDTPAV